MTDATRATAVFTSAMFEAVALAVILIGFAVSLAGAAARLRSGRGGAYEAVRTTFARSVLLALEMLVAADLIRTVTVQLTLGSLAVLAGLVAIRTFLSWSFQVEIDGRWPWQRARTAEGDKTGV